MGFTRLQLVQPCEFPSAEAQAMAAHANDVLAGASVYASLEEALAGASLIVGLSARPRRLAAPAVELRECARRVMSAAGQQEVALLFGREHSGLTNDELDRCHLLVHIPANPKYSSLNLAAAVQVVCYELRMAALGEGTVPTRSGRAVESEHLEEFYRYLERLCRDTGFMDKRNERILMRRIRRLFNRAGPDRKEVNILRGMLSYFERRRDT